MDDIEAARGAVAGIRARVEDGVPVITISGELDLSNVDRIQAAIGAAAGGERQRIIFEAADLEYMDSSGIALLVTVARQVADVEIRQPTDIVRRIIEISGVDHILRMVP
jgi:anti-anti-sigma factor